MAAAKILAFDLGAESGRAVFGRLEGGRLDVREVHRFPNVPLKLFGHIHWNVYALLDEMKKAMKACAEERPASLGIDTWGVDFGLVARDGTILGLPYCYRDSRNEGAMEAYLKLVPREALYEATGIQFMPFNTLFQVYAMVRERSPLLDAASDLLFMPDLFNYLLTGKKASEFTMATTSQMLDPRTRSWQTGLFQAMGFSRRILQQVLEPGTVLGPLLPAVAAETGLGAVPVVATASHDTGAAVAAAPAVGGDWAYISSGTWSLVGVEERSPVITRDALERNFTNEGGVAGTTRFLKNVTGLWLVQQCRKAWPEAREAGYEELVRGAGEAPPFQALVDPDDPGFLRPPDMPEAIRAYCRRTGQAPPATEASLVRSILESLALKYRLVIDQIDQVVGHPVGRIHVIGGGSRNRLLCQFTADATGRPVVAGPAEATAVGNVLVQAMALGLIGSLAELRAVVRESFSPASYEPRQDMAWRAAYDRFRALSAT
ncbi:MAG TPA: rhamnulokinase family protein [Terriglobales bacterium]|nr:rhamnulokinase family protein [Terriglobales bacterium]